MHKHSGTGIITKEISFADRLGTLVLHAWNECAFFNSFWRISMKKVGIVMGSDSDLPIIRKATEVLDSFCTRLLGTQNPHRGG